MRKRFEEQLGNLNKELITMGTLCEDAIVAVVAYMNGLDKKEQIADLEKQIDAKQRAIESLCMKLLLQQQPVAGDLRVISSALKMISDMERIGDQACVIYGRKKGCFDCHPGYWGEIVHEDYLSRDYRGCRFKLVANGSKVC